MSDNYIKFECPKCDKRLKIPAKKQHRKINCPVCNVVFRINSHTEDLHQSAHPIVKPLGQTVFDEDLEDIIRQAKEASQSAPMSDRDSDV